MATLQKITTQLWFDSNAEEAVKFYTSIFKNSSVGRIAYYGKVGFEQHHRPAGSVMTVEFTIEGQDFLAINAGPIFKFNESICFIIYCDTQDEIDYYWGKLTNGGDKSAQICGWLKDRYGVSWQVSFSDFPDMIVNEKGSEKTERVLGALYKMHKIDIETLKKAYEGEYDKAISG